MAEGAGGKEVGRISIRVVPNTDKFREDLQRQLDRIEDESRVKIRVDPDMDGFRDKVDAATRGLKDAKVKVKTEFDRRGDMIHDLDSAIEDAGRDAKKLDITPNINQSSFQKALRDVKAQAKLADTKVDISFKNEQAEARLESLIARLKAIAKSESIKVTVDTEHRERGGFRGAWDRSRDGGAEGAGGFGGGVAGAGLKILGDQTLLIAAAVVALLAPALALLSSALVSLPALITAVALPIGVFALGIGGVKKALDDSGILKDAQEYGKNGKPKGKDKQSLGEVLKDAQKQVSDVFEKGFTPIFKQIAGVIPQLASGLPQVAQGIVNLAQGVTSVVTSSGNIQNLKSIMGNVSQMLTNLGPGLGTFANSIVTLAAKVSTHLPGLATYFDNFATRLGNWVDKVSKPGPDFWGKATPSTLDKAVTGLKPTLDAIQDFVGQLLNAGLQMASNPDMGKNIQNFINGIKDFVTNSLPDLMAFFNSMAGLIKTLGLGHDQQPTDADLSGNHPRGATPQAPHGVDSDGRPVSQNGRETDTGKFTPDLNGIKALLGLGKGGWWDTAVTGSSKWLDEITKGGFTRPKTDHPVIVQQGGGQQQNQQPQPAQQPKVELNSVAQSIQGATGQIAAAANAAFKALSDAATVAVSQSVQAVQQLPGAIAQALSGVYQAALAAGQSIGTGMAAGIAAGAPSAIAAAQALAQGVENATKVQLGIHSPSKVFQGIGENTAQGYQDGLEGGFQGVLDSAKNLNQQLTSVFSGGAPGDIGAPGNPYAPDHMPSVSGARPSFITDLPGSKDGPGGGITVPTGFGSDLQSKVQDQLKAIKVEQDKLRADKDGTADKGQKKAIQSQIDQLNISKDQLKASAAQLGYSQKYGDSEADSTKQKKAQLDLQEQQLKAQYDATTDPAKRRALKVQMDQLKAQKDMLGSDKSKDGTDKTTQMLGQSVNKMVDIGKNFAMANVNQFENDIGISGKGAIPTIANIGLDWATSTLSNMASGLIGGGMGGGVQHHIHVNSVPEGLAADQHLKNRQGLTYNAGR